MNTTIPLSWNPFIFTFRGRYEAITGVNPPPRLLRPVTSTVTRLTPFDLLIPRDYVNRVEMLEKWIANRRLHGGYGKSVLSRSMAQRLASVRMS